MRIRQLSAAKHKKKKLSTTSELAKHSDLQMVKLRDGGNGRELLLHDSSMVKVLQHMQSKAATPAGQKRCCKVLMPLIVMGATEIADVVSADGKMVLNIQDLRRKYGTHTVGHKQARALHKLAHLLHTEQPVGKLTSTQLTQAYIEQQGMRKFQNSSL